ncbi:MAG TPA: phospholipid carrier-dependent glycosyltransferase [Candidatus Limnocylindrales bacterium]
MTAPAWELPDRATSGSRTRSDVRRGVPALLVLLGAGLALRVVLALRLPGSGFEVDLNAFRFWAGNLADQGPFGFYSRPFFHDYTPGYLYFLWLIGVVGGAIGGIGDLIKVPAILADLAVAWLVCDLVLELTANRTRAILAAAVVLFTPLTWFDSVVWGQVDSVGLVFLLLGVRDLWHDRPERSALWAATAAVIKPQLGILVPIVAVVVIRRAIAGQPADADAGETLRPAVRPYPWWRIVTTGLTGLATAIVLSAPFGLSLPDLLHQVAETAGGYPWLTVNAYNPWALLTHDGAGLAATGQWVCDAITTSAAGTSAGTPCQPGMETLIGPFWAVAVGGALLVLATLAVLGLVAWRPDRRTILVGLTVLAIAFFVLPTRVHERYLFPFVALGVVLAAASWRWTLAYVVLSATTFLNMYVVLTTLYPDNPQIADWLGIGSAIRDSQGVTLIALLNAAAFAWAIAQLRPAAGRAFAREVAGATPSTEPRGFGDDERATPAPAWAVPPAWTAEQAPPSEPPEVDIDDRPGLLAWLRATVQRPSIRHDRSATLAGEPGGRLDRLDLWVVAVLVIAALLLRTWRLAEPYQMHFDEVYHARTATEFLQKWRYGIDHDIYEWTHPHVAKYAMAAGLVLFGDDQVTGTSPLGVPVLDAAIEPRRDDPAVQRAGDRLYVATGTDVRAYDLTSRAEVATIRGSAATALAIDAAAGRLYVGAADGSIRTLSTALALDEPASSARPIGAETAPLATVDGPVDGLTASGDGSWLAVRSGDRVTLVDPDTGAVTGTATVAGLAALAPAGTGDALVARPADVPDPKAAASAVARIAGGKASTYASALATDADEVTLPAVVTTANKPLFDSAIGDGSLAGFRVDQQPRLVPAGRDGLTFLSPTSGAAVGQTRTNAPATGLSYVTVDTPRLYVATGRTITIVSLGDNGAGDPKIDSTMTMPGQVETTYWDPATLMVHALGRTATGAASTIYVIEPHANSVYADARLPFVPTATALDIAPDYPGADREQILAFDATGETAVVDIGQNAFAWRFPGVLAGALTAGLIYLLARLLFRRRSVALLAGGLTLADGMFFVMARIGMNDVYVGLFLVAAYVLFVALWQLRGAWRLGFWLGMPVLGVLLGLALASKWVAAYAIGAVAVLILARSALGRLMLLAGLVAGTTVLGYMAIAVPSGAASGPNLTFILVMVALTGLAVVAAVTHPVAWSREESRLAIAAPPLIGLVLAVAVFARGTGQLHLGSLSLPAVVVAIAIGAVGPLAWVAFTIAAGWGFGPYAVDGEDAGDSVDRPPAEPAPGWLRPGWALGVPVAWAAVCLVAIPLAVYVASYVPWAFVDGHQIVTGWPPGHDGQTLVQLTQQMYDYHNNLRSPHAASSPWWAWPLDLKPVWFYQGSYAGSTAASIYDAGNIVIWWLSIPALLFVAWQAFRRRSLALGLIGIGYACQWLAWSRIDRATFQYHYYTSLPFVVIALAYLLAEVWHGPSWRTWLLARVSAAAVVVGPMVMWVFKAPLCVFVGVERASPGSLACQGNPGNLVVTARTTGLAVVVVVAILLVVRELLASDLTAARPGGRLVGGTPGRIALIVGAAGLALGATLALDPTTAIFRLDGFRPELAGLLVLIPLAAVAWVILTARDPRRFVVGVLAGIGGWFLVLYPNIAALPLPDSLVNAYQGLLPTYLYPFQFPVNTDPVPPGVKLIAAGPLLLAAGLVVFCLVVAYSAWLWRLALVDREGPDGGEAAAAPRLPLLAPPAD